MTEDPAAKSFIEYQSRIHTLDYWKVEKTIDLLESGSTVPFIARYRRGETGDLPAEIIFSIQRSFESFTSLVKTRNNRLQKLTEKGLLNETLKQRFVSCLSLEELEDLWAPYKEKKQTKAQKAKEIPGIEELSQKLLESKIVSIHAYEKSIHIPPSTDKNSNISTLSEAVEAVLVDVIGHEPTHTSTIKQKLSRNIKINTSLVQKENKSQSKYADYDDFERYLHDLAPHQILAIRRGKDCGELSLKIAPSAASSDGVINDLHRYYRVHPPSHPRDEDPHSRNHLLSQCIVKAVHKVISPAVARAAWRDSLAAAEEAAVSIFARNLRHLLLTPPLTASASSATVIAGLDPGFANGHKLAIIPVSNRRLLLASEKLHTTTASARARSVERLRQLCFEHGVGVVAVGDGQGCREAQELVAEAISILPNVHYAVVSEAGASVYSASSIAREEFPDVDISYLGSVSIARRLVDPLSELVKIPPSSLGIGMYQHDIEEKVLQRRLGEVVEECVNEVGADLNTASEHILKYVSGLNAQRARAIIEFREANGPFTERRMLMNVKGIGGVSYVNAIGFLRVVDGPEILDSTCVHPEHYPLARKILTKIGISHQNTGIKMKGVKSMKSGLNKEHAIDLSSPIEVIHPEPSRTLNRSQLNQFFSTCDWEALARDLNTESSLLRSIAQWLGASPGDGETDVRRLAGQAPALCRGLSTTSEIAVGSQVEGTVKNIAAFGVFVDVGQGKTGLLHKSKSGNNINSFAVGQRLRVYIVSIDVDRGRISLSMSPPNQPTTASTLKRDANMKPVSSYVPPVDRSQNNVVYLEGTEGKGLSSGKASKMASSRKRKHVIAIADDDDEL